MIINHESNIAFITGGGTGIGKAIALRLVDEGVKVILAGRRKKPLLQAMAEVKKKGGDGLMFVIDVTRENDVIDLFKQIESTYGYISLLVNSAGVIGPGAIEDISVSDFRRVIDINLTSVFITIKAAINGMKKNGYGSILNIASISGEVVFDNRSAYCSSKAAVIHLTRELALELSKYNIRVNCISPGFIKTDLSMQIVNKYPDPNKQLKKRMDEYPLKRFGKVEEIAEGAIFLLLRKVDWITGINMTIDGGYVLK